MTCQCQEKIYRGSNSCPSQGGPQMFLHQRSLGMFQPFKIFRRMTKHAQARRRILLPPLFLRSLAASVSQDTVQNCYTYFVLRPRHRTSGPAYFSSIACTVADNSCRPGLRSAERGDLFVPRTRTTRLGNRSFFIAAPVVWNSLPLHLHSPSISRSQFRPRLKTQPFRLTFHTLNPRTIKETEQN